MAVLKKQKKEKDQPVKAEKGTEAPKKSKKQKRVLSEKKVNKKGISKKALQVLARPLVTEKVAAMSDQNVLAFEVSKTANRIEIKQAFKELYGVLPVRVNVMNMRGKRVAFGRKLGKRKDWKKAFITLPKGVHVDIFEGI